MNRTLVVAVVVAMTLAACASEKPGGRSGDGNDPPASGDAMASFVEEAESICAHSKELIQYIPPPKTYEAWRGYGARVASIYDRAVDRLDELDPPETLAEDYSRWTALLGDAGAAFEDLYQMIARRDPEAVVEPAILRSDKIEGRVDDLVQLEMTDLGACFGVTPFYQARVRATGACGGFLFCED